MHSGRQARHCPLSLTLSSRPTLSVPLCYLTVSVSILWQPFVIFKWFLWLEFQAQKHRMTAFSLKWDMQCRYCLFGPCSLWDNILLYANKWQMIPAALWIDRKLCCNCNESLADTSSNETQRGIDPDMCFHAQIQTLNPSGLSCVGPSRQQAGTKPIISRCALVLLSEKKNQEIWGYIMAPQCKFRVEPCSVQCWEDSLLATSYTSHGHQSQTVATAHQQAGWRTDGLTGLGLSCLLKFQAVADWEDYLNSLKFGGSIKQLCLILWSFCWLVTELHNFPPPFSSIPFIVRLKKKKNCQDNFMWFIETSDTFST